MGLAKSCMLLDGTFASADKSGQEAFDQVVRAYAEATQNLAIKLSEYDSVVTQLELLASFYEALAKADGVEAKPLAAMRLHDLAQRLHPSRRHPARRPTSAPGNGAPVSEATTQLPVRLVRRKSRRLKPLWRVSSQKERPLDESECEDRGETMTRQDRSQTVTVEGYGNAPLLLL